METNPERVTGAFRELGRAAEALDWPPERTVVEFTQHAGDELWRVSGLGTDWTPAEATRSL